MQTFVRQGYIMVAFLFLTGYTAPMVTHSERSDLFTQNDSSSVRVKMGEGSAVMGKTLNGDALLASMTSEDLTWLSERFASGLKPFAAATMYGRNREPLGSLSSGVNIPETPNFHPWLDRFLTGFVDRALSEMDLENIQRQLDRLSASDDLSNLETGREVLEAFQQELSTRILHQTALLSQKLRFDEEGNVSGISLGELTFDFGFDAKGNLNEILLGREPFLQIIYNEAGVIEHIVNARGDSFQLHYENGKLIDVKDPSGNFLVDLPGDIPRPDVDPEGYITAALQMGVNFMLGFGIKTPWARVLDDHILIENNRFAFMGLSAGAGVQLSLSLSAIQSRAWGQMLGLSVYVPMSVWLAEDRTDQGFTKYIGVLLGKTEGDRYKDMYGIAMDPTRPLKGITLDYGDGFVFPSISKNDTASELEMAFTFTSVVGAVQGIIKCRPEPLPAQETVNVTINGWRIGIDENSGEWSIIPPGQLTPAIYGVQTCEKERLRRFPAVQVATGEPFVRNHFGSFQIQMKLKHTGMLWTPTSGARPEITVESSSVSIEWPLLMPKSGDQETAGIRFQPKGLKDLQVSLISSRSDVTAGELSFTCQDNESFFGLGTQSVGMDLRGGTYPLWTQEQGIGKPEQLVLYPYNNIPEAAYAPMGIWHSSKGYSAILTHDRYSELDLCDAQSDRATLRSYGQMPGFVLVSGKTPKERLEAISAYVGRITEPPAWVFAPWNDAVGGPDRLWEIANTLRSNDIPSSAIWSEDWIGNIQKITGFMLSYAWAWDPNTYPDLPADVLELHRQGFAFLGYFNPFVPSTTPMWDEGVSGKFLVKNEAGDPYVFIDPGGRITGLVDLTNPQAVVWLKSYLNTAATDIGLDGWMADFAEWLPVDAVMYSGERGWEAHNRYPLDWQKASREALSAAHTNHPSEASNNWTFFARSGWASINGGTAGIAPTMWGGDQNTNWGYDDGYPTVVPIGTHVGLSGVPIFGSDIAGFSSFMTTPNTTKELFLRWCSLGAFHALMRTHHGSDECGNWSFDRDDESLKHFKRYASLHTLLYPYFQNLLKEAKNSGLPMMRHPYLVEPNRPGLWQGKDYEFFLGDDLLIAPILTEGTTSKTVILPEKGWWPLFGDTPVSFGSEGTGSTWSYPASATYSEIPVFVRPGTILPLLWDIVDSFYGASTSGMTDLDDILGYYRLGLYPDSNGNLRQTTVGVATVSGQGWVDTRVNWSQAKLNGVTLPTCTNPNGSTSCIDTNANAVILVGKNLTLTYQNAQLVISALLTQRYKIAMVKNVWGTWAQPTEVTDLNPDIPSPCE